ncbi:COG3203 Outer membrane protein (porin) [Vibrio sp. B1FLJ16]|uniref:porin n=1 Tax=Vibrio sp. B1FLJ16 TaxID=2751178 RepID=UPI0015F44251|nr:porin [Vibrio sp. B1FLJ16]MCA0934810.1 porin [Vibrio alginolyticus]CAD7810502.1 COG3203 Outer membrane protein (porin) [Vibrio sp. B1FLJ16]CAE6912496.1 COG3203 Outer membrane protein (porin) [Vibrio sp. B1FLJ16]
MKKTLIALSVSAAAMATGVNAAELYNQDGTSLEMGGRAEARLAMEDGDATDNSRVRLNFLGKQAISDELYGVGFWEGEFTTNEQGDVDSNNDLNTRYLYAGLGGAWGEFTYGKNEGALGVITDFTDIMAYHGNSAAAKLAVSDRTDNMMSYKGQFENLSVKASYRFADANNNGGDNGQDGYSLSAIYAFGDTGLNVGAGFADQDESDEFMLATSYTIGDLYFAGVYTDGEDLVGEKKNGSSDKDYTGYELAAAYTMGQTVFTTTYNNAEEGDAEVENFAIDATYYFKPNFRGYTSYNFNLVDGEEDQLALGLRYDF